MPYALPPSVVEPLLIHGDSLDELRKLPDHCVHVVITDPPAGIGFMGATWDSFAGYQARTERGREVGGLLAALGLRPWERGFVTFMTDVWSEVVRVVIPGGLICAWALPKTADLAGLAMRLAGLTMRDSLLHLFGGGMNKTGDVGKAIDRAAGAEREVVGVRSIAYADSDTWGTPNNSGRVGGNEHVYGGGEVETLPGGVRPVTAPATDAAKRWTGWYPGIAPGHEQWLIGETPGRLTYARQSVERGCGLFNVGACLVPRGEGVPCFDQVGPATQGTTYGAMAPGSARTGESTGGSHPRNAVLTPGGEGCPVEGLDRQSGVSTSHGVSHRSAGVGMFAMPAGRHAGGTEDAGGASRYFTQVPFDQRVGYYPKARDRRAGLRAAKNRHPTHKHVGLMRWLVRLMAAKAEQTGGEPAIVLDTFMGSGPTGVACVAEGVRFVGIELDREHYETGRARVAAAIGDPNVAREENERLVESGGKGQLSLV